MAGELGAFAPDLIDAIGREREVELTTYGRRTGKPSTKILWAYTDGTNIYVRSGGGLGRDWTSNVLARGEGVLHVAGINVPVRLRHLDNLERAREVSDLARAKYGPQVQRSEGDQPATLAETATFELTPGGATGAG
jgi:hypothetical protein